VLWDSGRGDPPQLHIFDTEQRTTIEPIQTSFSLPTARQEAYDPCLLIEPCGHISSPDELITAPFYPDRSQRILAFNLGRSCYAINAELLLKLAREREGQDVGWDEWGAHTIEVRGGDLCNLWQIWVSGCRLFCTVSNSRDDDDPSHMRIYDFSHAGRAKNLRTSGKAGKHGRTRRISPSIDGYELPWNSFNFCDAISTTGHDSIVFSVVSSLTSCPQSSKGFISAALSRTRTQGVMNGLNLRKWSCMCGVFKRGTSSTRSLKLVGTTRDRCCLFVGTWSEGSYHTTK
jgi:hypothetical protein